MAKPDPALLDPSRYPYACSIEPRFADLDINRHINNVALTSFLEDARVRLYRENGYRHYLTDYALMIVSLAVEYLGQAHYPDPIKVHCAVEKSGRTSHTLIHVMTQGETVVAFARCVMVAMGPDGTLASSPEDGYAALALKV